MTITAMEWAGLVFIFVVTFLISLFHASLSTSSKISLSHLLENKDKEHRQRMLDVYDEIKIALESVRILFIVAFLAYLYKFFPQLKFRFLWLFLVAFAVYFLFFEYLPHLINAVNKKAVLAAFLPSFGLIRVIAAPIFLVLRRLEAREPEEENREASDEEIDTFIDEAREEGIIEKDENNLLRSVVEFGNIVVREIMTPRTEMVCISRDATLEKLRELVVKEKYSRIPVYKDRLDNIEGLIIIQDLLEVPQGEAAGRSIEPLIRPVSFVPEAMKVYELLKEFQKLKQKLAIVVDEHGGVSGLVTMEDLVEEIVGEIQDEYDQEENRITPNGPDDYAVSGDVEIDEVEKLFDLDLAEDNYITVSGLITHELGRLPRRGESFAIKGLVFDILEVDQKRIIKVRVRKPKPDGEPEEKKGV